MAPKSKAWAKYVLLVGFIGAIGTPAAANVRVFMAVDGQQGLAPTSGNTTLTMAAGTTQRVMVWIEDTTQTQQLSHYQMVVRWEAVPQNGASGTVVYVDNPAVLLAQPGPPGGQPGEDPAGLLNSAMRFLGPNLLGGSDWGGEDAADAAAAALLGLSSSPKPDWATVDSAAPSAAGVCSIPNDCWDLDFNGVRDDPCVWWDCVDGACVGTDVMFGDIGGGPIGGPTNYCIPDGVVNIYDYCHTLLCFAATDPCPSCVQMDVGAAFGACPPDGFVNIFDTSHILALMGGTNICATCPLDLADPNPPAPGGNSVFIDSSRTDHVFFGVSGLAAYTEHAPPPAASAGFKFLNFTNSIPVTVTVTGMRYLGEFDLAASADACGEHELVFVTGGGLPGGGCITTNICAPYQVDEFQNLTVIVTPPATGP